jgi:15-cis-phytoene synthase/lycopene beta-cyclase
VSNTLVVFGQIATDHALAILTAFPALFPEVPPVPSPWLLTKALATPHRDYDARRLQGLQDAVGRLRAKSRSFWLASAAFEGRLRVDLLLLYVHCARVPSRAHRCPAATRSAASRTT